MISSAREGTRRRGVMVAAVAALVVLALVPLLRFGSDLGQRRWVERCQAMGGRVETVPRTDNPLIVQTDDPAFDCRTVDGRILSRRR